MGRAMKKVVLLLSTLIVTGFFVLCSPMSVYAKEEYTILEGIYADELDLSHLTQEEAKKKVFDYVAELGELEITLLSVEDNEVVTTMADLGLNWTNPEVIEEAASHARGGNFVSRYKATKDLQENNVVYNIELSIDKEALKTLIAEECSKYDVEEIDYSLERSNGQFTVIEGSIGYSVDVDASTEKAYRYLMEEWERTDCQIAMEIIETDPKGSVEELSVVKDVIGSFSTSYATSGAERSANVANGCRLINGTVVYPGDEFSTYELVSPYTYANGYYPAGSYVSGKVVDSIGGGICQVSTTLYNAVLLAELEVTERHNHSMIVTYVEPSADAAVAESAGKDFRFVNNTNYPIYIEGITTADKRITFNIYGVEERNANRKVTYESVILSTDVPTNEVIYADPSQPVGYIKVQSAHIGYKAQLWKVVTVDGVEVSRTQVNSSSYAKSPRSATVGTATDNPQVLAEINAAIGTSNIDHVKNIAAMLAAGQIVTNPDI